MSILISSEVEQNRLLSKSEPGVYRLYPTFLVACSVCDNNFYAVTCIKFSGDLRAVIHRFMHMIYITPRIERKLST
jgi:hypothetical protein